MKCVVSSLLTLFACLAGVVAAQDDTPVDATEKRHRRMLELAQSYKLTIAGESVSLRDKPLFRWSTPERQAIGGEMYVWTYQGRPVATIGIWTYDDVKDSHEVQSLATEPLVAVSPLFPDWRPSATSLRFQELKGVPPPSNSPVRRQTQMRSLLREKFSGQMTQDNGTQLQLRLLPQPLFRYETMPEGVFDGAMFALAFGTDPEILILLEARNGDASSSPASWHYAFAPSTSARVIGRIDSVDVWNNEDKDVGNVFRMIINR
jgi:hypothetical protein